MMWQASFEVGLLNSNLKASDLTRIILNVLEENNPQSVEQLTKILTESLDLTEDDIIKSVLKLQTEGIIKLQNQTLELKKSINYLKTGGAIWFWLTIAIGTITSILTLTISESANQWVFIRNILGLVFILFLPGFAFVKALFQNNLSHKNSIGNLETIQHITLSVGMSIVLVTIVGFLLYYSPWGLNLITIVPSLFLLTSLLATAAVIREYKKNSVLKKRSIFN
jgi:hypothetical protein